jgi:hypothetical protein
VLCCGFPVDPAGCARPARCPLARALGYIRRTSNSHSHTRPCPSPYHAAQSRAGFADLSYQASVSRITARPLLQLHFNIVLRGLSALFVLLFALSICSSIAISWCCLSPRHFKPRLDWLSISKHSPPAQHTLRRRADLVRALRWHGSPTSLVRCDLTHPVHAAGLHCQLIKSNRSPASTLPTSLCPIAAPAPSFVRGSC